MTKTTYHLFDGIEFLAGELRGRDGELRTAWRLLRQGENRLKKGGQEFVLALAAEDIAGAVRFQQEKGEKIPIDSRHALFFAAEAAGVSETEVLRTVPQGVAAMGFGNLAERDGDLWIVDVEWLPLAAELFRQKQLRYFSPVVRGLNGQGPVRITSVAMDNVPALCDLEILAASGEEPGHRTQEHKEDNMKKLEAALRKLLGDTGLALAAETESDLAQKVDALAAELPGLRQKAERADALELAAETAGKTALIAAALADGRVCNAQKDLLMKMDKAVLAEFLAATPKGQAVPTEPAGALKKDAISLTAEEQAVARSMGLKEEDMLAEKKRLALTAGGAK